MFTHPDMQSIHYSKYSTSIQNSFSSFTGCRTPRWMASQHLREHRHPSPPPWREVTSTEVEEYFSTFFCKLFIYTAHFYLIADEALFFQVRSFTPTFSPCWQTANTCTRAHTFIHTQEQLAICCIRPPDYRPVAVAPEPCCPNTVSSFFIFIFFILLDEFVKL